MAKKSQQQLIVDRLVRTLQPFGKTKRARILKIVELTLDEADEEDDDDPELIDPELTDDMSLSPTERKALEGEE